MSQNEGARVPASARIFRSTPSTGFIAPLNEPFEDGRDHGFDRARPMASVWSGQTCLVRRLRRAEEGVGSGRVDEPVVYALDKQDRRINSCDRHFAVFQDLLFCEQVTHAEEAHGERVALERQAFFAVGREKNSVWVAIHIDGQGRGAEHQIDCELKHLAEGGRHARARLQPIGRIHQNHSSNWVRRTTGHMKCESRSGAVTEEKIRPWRQLAQFDEESFAVAQNDVVRIAVSAARRSSRSLEGEK